MNSRYSSQYQKFPRLTGYDRNFGISSTSRQLHLVSETEFHPRKLGTNPPKNKNLSGETDFLKTGITYLIFEFSGNKTQSHQRIVS